MNTSLLTTITRQMGDAGLRMSRIEAAEGAAGNISVFVAQELEPFPELRSYSRFELPVAAAHLAGGWLVVTGASRRLRDIAEHTVYSVCLLHIEPGGATATLYAAESVRPTSELNTHLAVHNHHAGSQRVEQHAVVHAQPVHLTYLSHIARYQETAFFNRRLLRWQPETVIEFPEGIGVLPFQIPGSPEQQQITTEALATYRAIVWARHGIVTRSAAGVGKAGDLVDYAETAARYEYLNLQAGEPAIGLSEEDIRAICGRLGIRQTVF